MSEKLKVALLVDNESLSKWERDAISKISDLVEIVIVLSCTNTVTAKRPFTHGAYYMLNFMVIRTPLTRKRRVDFGGCPILEFKSRYEGAWQWIPNEVTAAIADSGARVMLKFGMSLLKMDNLAAVDVLSFHHGDPSRYRGRPAGFYELLHGARSVGFIVQKLSNVLDAGEVLAMGHAKAYEYSYRQTITEIYSSSPVLLRHAVINFLAGKRIPIKAKGKNYRLPSNWLVARFCWSLLARKCKRLSYGFFWEKRWNIAVFDSFDFRRSAEFAVSVASTAKLPAKYNFYADPFFSFDGSCIRAEALIGSTGRGEIVELDSKTLEPRCTLLSGPHFSYPYTFVDGGREYVVPEVASHASPYLLDVANAFEKIPLRGLDSQRLVDPSLVKLRGRYYLFGGHPDSAGGMLQLYVADCLVGPYSPHRLNPIVIDPSCARMGGRLLIYEERLYRFGQDNSDSYGNGIHVMEVTKIDRDVYEEKQVGQLRFADANGPHTVDIRNGKAVLDFYVNRFALLAGYRRLAAKIHGKFFT